MRANQAPPVRPGLESGWAGPVARLPAAARLDRLAGLAATAAQMRDPSRLSAAQTVGR